MCWLVLDWASRTARNEVPSPARDKTPDMKFIATVALVLCFALLVSANARSPLSVLSKPQPLSRTLNPPMEPFAFSYSNCGSSSDPTQLQFLQVSPDPIVLGKNATIAARVYLSETISNTSGVTVSLEIYKKFFGAWIYVPCVDGVGSCTINDLCDRIHPGDSCPLAPWGIPCQCPFKVGTYNVPPPGFSAHLKNPNLSWLTNGDIKVQATLKDANGNRLICTQIVASITTA